MTEEHLPECPKSGCPACYEQGQRDALDAAREAVYKVKVKLRPVVAGPLMFRREDVLSAIDALREERQ